MQGARSAGTAVYIRVHEDSEHRATPQSGRAVGFMRFPTGSRQAFHGTLSHPSASESRMYLEFYGLKEPPFSITPDPRFVYLSERHRDALAHLLYGIGQGGGGGFVQLTGEVGTGKTTLSRLLLEQLPEKTQVALVLNPRLSPVELVETICEELHLDLSGRRGSLKSLVDVLNHHLLDAYAAGKRVVVIIDEAQELSRAAQIGRAHV